MKIQLVLSACLLLSTGSNAFLGGFFDFLANIGESVGEAALPVADNLLKSLETTGKQVLSQTIQDLMLHLGNLKLPKRELDLEKVDSFLKGVEEFISQKNGQFKEIFKTAINKLSNVENSVKNLDFLKEPLTNLVSKVEEAVVGHNAVADHLLSNIASEAVTFLKPLLGGGKKRGILDSLGLSHIGQSLADLFKPHIDSLKTLINAAGGTLKTHATNLLGAVKGSVNELGSKLSTHVDTLKTHLGTITSTAGEALATLKDAVSQVMQDTFGSLHNPVSGIVNTLTGAVGTIANHFAPHSATDAP